MANKTTNYKLTKPLESEFYDVVDKHRNKELWVKDKGRWKLRNPLV